MLFSFYEDLLAPLLRPQAPRFTVGRPKVRIKVKSIKERHGAAYRTFNPIKAAPTTCVQDSLHLIRTALSSFKIQRIKVEAEERA